MWGDQEPKPRPWLHALRHSHSSTYCDPECSAGGDPLDALWDSSEACLLRGSVEKLRRWWSRSLMHSSTTSDVLVHPSTRARTHAPALARRQYPCAATRAPCTICMPLRLHACVLRRPWALITAWTSCARGTRPAALKSRLASWGA